MVSSKEHVCPELVDLLDKYFARMYVMGFQRCRSLACVFWHPEWHIITSVHGDDFPSAGPKEALDWFRAEMEKNYELKEAARLGPGPGDDKEGRVLNRIVRWLPRRDSLRGRSPSS